MSAQGTDVISKSVACVGVAAHWSSSVLCL